MTSDITSDITYDMASDMFDIASKQLLRTHLVKLRLDPQIFPLHGKFPVSCRLDTSTKELKPAGLLTSLEATGCLVESLEVKGNIPYRTGIKTSRGHQGLIPQSQGIFPVKKL